MDNLRITDIFFLCGYRHQQVVSDQPGNQFGIRIRNIVLFAKVSGYDFTQYGMIAAFALGNIMKKTSQIEKFGFCNQHENVIAKRQFIIMFVQREAAQIANQEQGMLVDRINME